MFRWLATLFILGATSAQAGDGASLELKIRGLESTEGHVIVVLFKGEDGFPSEPDKAFRKTIIDATTPVSTAVFGDLPPGDYAAFAFHDVDDDLELATRWPIPIPKEPIGSTRDAKVRFGPPKYRDATFDVAEGQAVIQVFTLARIGG